MSREARSNVYLLALPRTALAEPAEDGGASTDRVDRLKSVLACLEYLYGEAVRLQTRMGAHLIGTAAESLRGEIARTRDEH